MSQGKKGNAKGKKGDVKVKAEGRSAEEAVKRDRPNPGLAQMRKLAANDLRTYAGELFDYAADMPSTVALMNEEWHGRVNKGLGLCGRSCSVSMCAHPSNCLTTMAYPALPPRVMCVDVC
jgi:hypothetical protein